MISIIWSTICCAIICFLCGFFAYESGYIDGKYEEAKKHFKNDDDKDDCADLPVS